MCIACETAESSLKQLKRDYVKGIPTGKKWIVYLIVTIKHVTWKVDISVSKVVVRVIGSPTRFAVPFHKMKRCKITNLLMLTRVSRYSKSLTDPSISLWYL